MPLDRLAELKVQEDGQPASSDVVIEMSAADDVTGMKEFFAQIEQVKIGLNEIRKKVQAVEAFHGKALTAVGNDTDKEGIDPLMDEANEAIQAVRNKLKVIENENKKKGAEAGKVNLSAEQRIRLSQHANMTQKFIDSVNEYQDIQQKYKTKYKDRLERQYKIVKPNATHEEIEKAMESGAGSDLFAQQILMGPQHAEAKKALYDIQERHQDIVKLEKSILELHQLFLDMAVLVEAQGDMINQIDNYVSSAADHTNKGVEEMKKAIKSQKKSRKRIYCILFLLMIIIVVAIIVVSPCSSLLLIFASLLL